MNAGVGLYGDPVISLSDPAPNAVAITPSDTVSLANVTRGVYIGVGGNISVVMQGAGPTATPLTAAIVFVGVLAGTILPIRVSQVTATGTTASSLVALW